MESLDHHVPVSTIVARLEAHLDMLRSELDKTPRWRFIHQQRLIGAIGAYRYEIDKILEISSGWQPFWRDLKKREKT